MTAPFLHTHKISFSLPLLQNGNRKIKLQTTGPKCLISHTPTAPADPPRGPKQQTSDPGRAELQKAGGGGSLRAFPSHQQHVTWEVEGKKKQREAAVIKQLSHCGAGELSHRNGSLFRDQREPMASPQHPVMLLLRLLLCTAGKPGGGKNRSGEKMRQSHKSQDATATSPLKQLTG